MTEPALSRDDEDAALAGEYVLGVLDLAERATVERRLRTDAAFAAQVQAWEARLSGMNDDFAEAPAPPLMPAIEARLFGKADDAQRRSREARSGWWARFVSGVVMAVLLAAVALTLLPAPEVGTPVLQATLQGEGQPLAFAARYDAGELTVTRTAGTAASAGQVHQLWLIAGEAAPVPLGLIETADLRTPLPVLPEGAVLAVSLEPSGGSPTGAPTGPVLVTGVVSRL